MGSRLLALRLERSMTQAQFADSIGISPRTYHHYEKGTRSVSAEAVLALHEVYGVSPNWILLGDQPPKQSEEGKALAAFVTQLHEHLLARGEKIPAEKAAKIYEQWLRSFRDGHVLAIDSVSDWPNDSRI